MRARATREEPDKNQNHLGIALAAPTVVSAGNTADNGRLPAGQS